MEHFVFNSLYGWLGLTGIIVVVCGVIAWFVPPLRKWAIMVGGVVLAAATIYARGSRDRAAYEQKLKDEAVKKAREKYAKIDARPDTPDSVDERLRNGRF